MALGWVGECDEDMPWGGDCEKDDRAGDGMELANAVEDGEWVSPREGKMGEDDEDRKDDSDEALGENVESAAGGEGVAEDWVGLGL